MITPVTNRISWSHSDNIPGLESQLEKNKLGQLNDDVRYSIKTKSFSQMDQQFGRREERLPEPQSKIEEKIYDITKVRSRLVDTPLTWQSVRNNTNTYLQMYLLSLSRMGLDTSRDLSRITRQ